MNKTNQQILVSRISKLINKLPPNRCKLLIQLSDKSMSRRKTTLAAEHVKANRGSVTVIKPTVSGNAGQDSSLETSGISPHQVMPLAGGEDVRMKPSGGYHIVHNAGE